MFLQTKLNQTARILEDAQVRSLSQLSMRIKKTFQNMKDKWRKHGSFLKENLCFISNKMK